MVGKCFESQILHQKKGICDTIPGGEDVALLRAVSYVEMSRQPASCTLIHLHRRRMGATMSSFGLKRLRATMVLLLGILLLGSAAESFAQRRPATLKDFLLQYKGKDIQIMDRTGGTEQFVAGDPTKTYVLTLAEVQDDYIVVSRNTSSDKRVFVYPMSVIRRIIFAYDWKPYQMILLELY
jgi:hypothetical protein